MNIRRLKLSKFRKYIIFLYRDFNFVVTWLLVQCEPSIVVLVDNILMLTPELQVLCYDSVCRIHSLPHELAPRDLEISWEDPGANSMNGSCRSPTKSHCLSSRTSWAQW